MSELSAREDPKIQFCEPCWELAYSTSAGFDPNFNLANRMWYWRGDRSAFGRFENDADGLFFMRGNPSSTGLQQGSGRKRPRHRNPVLEDCTLGDTDVIPDGDD